MNDLIKTLIFAVTGVLLASLALLINFATQPREIEEFALVGQPFYPDFDSVDEIKSLEIAAFDFGDREAKSFRVEFLEGTWRIPSHYDYPAEAGDRIGRTAASVMGIKREALAGRRASDHDRFGVIDPTSDAADDVADEDEVGVRVTLADGSGEALVDYVVGKQVNDEVDLTEEQLRIIRGETQRAPLHYVRRPDEDETYIASISVDASTRFVDWIEPDLLLLEQADLRRLVINDYYFEPVTERVEVLPGSGLYQEIERKQKVDGEQYTLVRERDFGPWELGGIDEETEELETSKISSLTNAIDQIEIQGVRPRFRYQDAPILTPELTIEFPDSITTQSAANDVVTALAQDLRSRGFTLSQSETSNDLLIASDQGEMMVGTSIGSVYHLYFGNIFTGSESEIEIGSESETSTDPEREPEGSQSAETDTEAIDSMGLESSDDAKSRYLLVRVSFDASLLGLAPVEPTPPVEPPAEGEESSTDNGMPTDDAIDTTDIGNADDETTDNENPNNETTDPSQQDPAGQDQEPEVPEVDPQVEYQRALIQYQAELTAYTQAKAAYERRLAEGQSEVDQLNARFGEWYYVISAESLDTLRLSRADLVKPKEIEEEGAIPGGGQDAIPSLIPNGIPGLDPGQAPRPPVPPQAGDSNADNDQSADGDGEANSGAADDTSGDDTSGGDTSADDTSGDGSTGDDSGTGSDSNDGGTSDDGSSDGDSTGSRDSDG